MAMLDFIGEIANQWQSMSEDFFGVVNENAAYERYRNQNIDNYLHAKYGEDPTNNNKKNSSKNTTIIIVAGAVILVLIILIIKKKRKE